MQKQSYHAISVDTDGISQANKIKPKMDSTETDSKNYCLHVDHDICSHLQVYCAMSSRSYHNFLPALFIDDKHQW